MGRRFGSGHFFGRIFAISSCLILLLVSFSPMVFDALGEQGAPENGIGEGDWIIEAGDNIVKSHEMIELTGNLSVQGDGNLTLDNVTLKMNCSENGEFKIEVLPGGKLNIINRSMVKALATSYNYDFYFRAGYHRYTHS